MLLLWLFLILLFFYQWKSNNKSIKKVQKFRKNTKKTIVKKPDNAVNLGRSNWKPSHPHGSIPPPKTDCKSGKDRWWSELERCLAFDPDSFKGLITPAAKGFNDKRDKRDPS